MSERRSFSRNHQGLSLQPPRSSGRERYRVNGVDSNIGQISKRWLVVDGIGLILIVAAVWLAFRGASGGMDDATVVALPTATTASGHNSIATIAVSMPTETAVPPTPTITETNPTITPADMQNPVPNFADLQQQLYGLINEARVEQGLSQLAWDIAAALSGQLHAEDMAQYNYFSHWNRDGLGPDLRYAQTGGQHAVVENIHAFSSTYENGQSASIEDWTTVIQNAHTGLMNSSGHRANILDPVHTHVGIGLAYNPETGQVRLAEEFTNQYVTLTQLLPVQASLGDTVTLSGQFRGGNISNVILSLAYEPFPVPISLADLARTGTYSSAAEGVETWPGDLIFNLALTLNYRQQPGYYHVRVFADIDGDQALVLDHVIAVR